MFLWFFYLGVHRSTGVFWWPFFIFYSSSRTRDPLSCSPRAYLICSADPGFLNETKGSLFFFLVFLHIQTDGKNKLFFYNHINIQIRRFFSELVESNSLGKYSLIMIRIGMNTALLALSLGMYVMVTKLKLLTTLD